MTAIKEQIKKRNEKPIRPMNEETEPKFEDMKSSALKRPELLVAPDVLKRSQQPRGNMRSRRRRFCSRAILFICFLIMIYFYTKQGKHEISFAKVQDTLHSKVQKSDCSPAYDVEVLNYPTCAPKQCGRFVTDTLIEANEADVLLDLAQNIFNSVSSSGSASILDIHTGALSHKDHFINVFKIPNIVEKFKEEHLLVYNHVKNKIQMAIAEEFDILVTSLHLTYPTFFSRLTNVTARTLNDEYWHEHVDKETYESFHYTSLLYLNTYNKEFKGGRFQFIDSDGKKHITSAVEPKKGRVSAFTSGAENRHYVEKVTEGERYAITIAFSCDIKHAIADPNIKKLVQERS